MWFFIANSGIPVQGSCRVGGPAESEKNWFVRGMARSVRSRARARRERDLTPPKRVLFVLFVLFGPVRSGGEVMNSTEKRNITQINLFF